MQFGDHMKLSQLTRRACNVAIALLFSIPAFAIAGTDDGVSALKQGDYKKAIEILTPLAEEGNPGAQFYLGQMYFDGQGVEKDFPKAFGLFNKAASGNYPTPQFRLGDMYARGLGVKKDAKMAYMWYEIAKALGAQDKVAPRLPQIESELNQSQVDEAKSNAKKWLKEHGYSK